MGHAASVNRAGPGSLVELAGYVVSRNDPCLLYFRNEKGKEQVVVRRGPLKGLLSMHLDDEGLGAEPWVIDFTERILDESFPTVKKQLPPLRLLRPVT